MKREDVCIGTIVAAVIMLAAMGCWFCWHCPSRVYEPHALFWRQLAWNGVGLAVFIGAARFGWKRWLKAAPWLMALWVLAVVAAQGFPAVRGTHRWIAVGPFRVNVMTCLVPVFALFAAWMRGRKWRHPWIEWTFLALSIAVFGCMVMDNPSHMKRLAAFFRPEDYMGAEAYMSSQLRQAFAAANWFGDAGKSLGFLPCPESDGMMAASALLFGRWFPVAVVFLFAVLGAGLSIAWKGIADAAGRRFVLFLGLWLIVPVAYCLLHSLSFLPVAGMSPALAGYGGSATVMAWWGMGVLAALAKDAADDGRMNIEVGKALCITAIWMAVAVLSVALLAVRCLIVQGDRIGKFAEPRPSDLGFGEFGLVAKRGRIFAANGSLLAHTIRTWRFYLDPKAVSPDVMSRRCRSVPYYYADIAQGLGISEDELEKTYKREDSRYIFLKEVDDESASAEYFERNWRRLTKDAGMIREPVQKRVYPLGEAATAVVGFMHGGSHTDTPQGAGGLEWAFDKTLAGTNGVYDAKFPMEERVKRAIPAPGADIHTTIVPDVQKAVWGVLAAACATNGAESAFALVMKVSSGEIAAMASWPSFDPSMRRNLDKWDSSMAVNRPAQVVFEPGGLAKPLTYAIALDSGVLAEDATINQEDGAWKYNGETYKDATTNSVTIAEAIEKHLNIAAGKTACRVGPEKFHAALHRFGFGSKTGTAGIPGEGTGILTSASDKWDKTTAMRVGMGYGFAATGLQIAQAYATLANHGTLVRPVLVKSAAINGVVQAVSPAAADAIMRIVKSPMPSTVQMCERDRKAGQTVYSPTNYIASCAGFVPVDKPEYVVVVSFSKPRPAHAGDEVAKPVFQSIADSL